MKIAGNLGKTAKKIVGNLRFMLKNLHKSLFFCIFASDFPEISEVPLPIFSKYPKFWFGFLY